jgi:hypothetical protein
VLGSSMRKTHVLVFMSTVTSPLIAVRKNKNNGITPSVVYLKTHAISIAAGSTN